MTTNPRVRVSRIYDEPGQADGARILVDRLWPRGVSKDKAALDDWCRQIAPSTDLRTWYAHDPDKFDEFNRRYLAELQQPERAKVLEYLRGLARAGSLTLLTATKRADISEAAVLAALINERPPATPPSGRCSERSEQPGAAIVQGPGQLGEHPFDLFWDIADEWGRQSFPASDPPSNW
jgi:uncharacterized protein YeaO (DUF488 family)